MGEATTKDLREALRCVRRSIDSISPRATGMPDYVSDRRFVEIRSALTDLAAIVDTLITRPESPDAD